MAKIRLSERARSVKPSPTLALTARAAELKRAGLPVIALAAGEPDFDTPESAKAAAVEAIREGFTKYTDVAGIPDLRRAIAERLARDGKAAYDPKEILVSCGAKHAIFNLLQALVGPGDEVIILSPYWVSYPDMAALAGARARIVPCRADFHPDPAAISANIGPATRVLILNSANNPTGAVYTEDEIRAILELCRERGIFAISDEIYERLVFPSLDGKPRRFVSVAAFDEHRGHVAVVNGCSKAFAMTGWRIGWAAAPAELIRAAADIQSQSTSNPASISQRAALGALARPDAAWERSMLAEFDARRRLVMGRLAAIPRLSLAEPEGAFYAFLRADGWYGRTVAGETIGGSEDLARVLLEKAHVALMPGKPFGDDRHLRISYAASRGTLSEALDRIARLLAGS